MADGLIGYMVPPKGNPEESTTSIFTLASLRNLSKKMDNSLDTVLKDTITTTSPDPYLELLEAYCKLNKRLHIHIKQKEREAMDRMVAGGMPNLFTFRALELLLEETREREGSAFKYPTSFLYYEEGIWEAWSNSSQ